MSNQFYAPRPVPAVHYYPPPNGPPPQDAPFEPARISPNPPSFNEAYQKEERIGVDYRSVVRTPSPTPSEAEALSGKKRKVSLKKYLDPEYLKNPRNLCERPRPVVHAPFPAYAVFSYLDRDARHRRSPHRVHCIAVEDHRCITARVRLATQVSVCIRYSARSLSTYVTSSGRTPGAWAIPIGVMIILSFPPVRLPSRHFPSPYADMPLSSALRS